MTKKEFTIKVINECLDEFLCRYLNISNATKNSDNISKIIELVECMTYSEIEFFTFWYLN